MGRYRVNHRYQSNTIALEAATEVELDDDVAAWLEHDSPGVLAPIDGPEPEPEPEAEPEAEPEPEAEAEVPAPRKRAPRKG